MMSAVQKDQANAQNVDLWVTTVAFFQLCSFSLWKLKVGEKKMTNENIPVHKSL